MNHRPSLRSYYWIKFVNFRFDEILFPKRHLRSEIDSRESDMGHLIKFLN